jgi:hypothetical protein
MKLAMAAAAGLVASPAWAVPAWAVPVPTASFAETVRAIRDADYRGERADLQRLASDLERNQDPALAPYRLYWAGFARWRRALNGFNETPNPPDLKDDLERAAADFEAALREKADWIEAQVGIVGCAGPLLYLAQDDAPRRQALLGRYRPVLQHVSENGAANPRALWQVGQSQAARGDPAKAVATFRQGIEAALREGRERPADEPAWIPRWGGAENLMNLAYVYTYTRLENRDLAVAYAEGTRVAVPEWHYVRDVLWPAILKLPATAPAASPSPAGADAK